MFTQVLLGIIYANLLEWLAHKYILHGLGKDKFSCWSFHWHDHHKVSRKNRFVDNVYNKSTFQFNSKTKEMLTLTLGVLCHFPLIYYVPAFFGVLVFSAALYFYLHKKSHKNATWARFFLTWHYDHHMGKNQDCNWCVTWPLFDWILGTRVKYAFTETEKLDLERKIRLRKHYVRKTKNKSS